MSISGTKGQFAVVVRVNRAIREVHAGYVSVAGTDIKCWTSVSGSLKSVHDFVCVCTQSRPRFMFSSESFLFFVFFP